MEWLEIMSRLQRMGLQVPIGNQVFALYLSAGFQGQQKIYQFSCFSWCLSVFQDRQLMQVMWFEYQIQLGFTNIKMVQNVGEIAEYLPKGQHVDNKMGPKTDPLGIPHGIATESDRFFIEWSLQQVFEQPVFQQPFLRFEKGIEVLILDNSCFKMTRDAS